ncbi:MAG TPA: hypothetical protein VFJ81_15810 [Gemmatimonadales bacterium]|nr:hypothetical protein [Gemmatimonadales bacterium]
MDWMLNLPVIPMSAVIMVAVWIVTAITYLVVTRLAVGDRLRAFKAISPGMLPPLAVIFALLVGFLAAQVWSDADRANTMVNREASALRAAVLLGDEFPAETEHRLRALIRQHIQTAVREEWPAMARRDATLTIVPTALAQALKLALDVEPHTPGQTIAQRELVTAIQTVLESRRQRIMLSASTVDGVKWGALLAQVILMLIAIAMVHCDNRPANRIILAIFATGAAASLVLIAAYSRPFSGAIAVRPTLLQQVMPETGGAWGL